jgi:hypothetical protein
MALGGAFAQGVRARKPADNRLSMREIRNEASVNEGVNLRSADDGHGPHAWCWGNAVTAGAAGAAPPASMRLRPDARSHARVRSRPPWVPSGTLAERNVNWMEEVSNDENTPP